MAEIKTVSRHTISEYKQKCNASMLDIVKSPKTGKLFFTCGEKVGAVQQEALSANEEDLQIRVFEVDGELIPRLEVKSSNVVRSF